MDYDRELRLMPSQRNALFEAVRDQKLSPADFALVPEYNPNVETVGGLMPPRLIHRPGGRPSGYYFEIEPRDPRLFKVEMSPGGSVIVEAYAAQSWEAVMEIVPLWLHLVQRETGQPDLWAGVLETAVGDNAPRGANDPLSQEERSEVREQIESARRYLATLGLARERLAYANDQLDYLVESSKRLGRFDWRQVAAGVAISIAIAAAFNPEQARTLFQLIVEPLQRLLAGS